MTLCDRDTMSDRCVQIAGGGVSGLVAAICLARSGVPVRVFERRKKIGGRFIGDFQVIENITPATEAMDLLKRFGLRTDFFMLPLREAVFFGPDLHPYPIASVAPFAYLIRRGEEDDTLESRLAAQAQEAGAAILCNHRLRRDQADIVATGPTAPDGLAKQAVFATGLADTIWVLFDNRYAPGGYAYLFVHQGRATLGCAITRDFDRMDNYFEGSRKRFEQLTPHLAPSVLRQARIGYASMSFSLKASAQVEARLFVGEAGGFQDDLFGLGLRYAMTTGFLAAGHFSEGISYDTAWKSALGALQETSLVNRALYEWGGNWGIARLVRKVATGDARDFLRRFQTPCTWKRLLLPWVKRGWQTQGRCVHPFHPHWCRKRPLRHAPQPS